MKRGFFKTPYKDNSHKIKENWNYSKSINHHIREKLINYEPYTNAYDNHHQCMKKVQIFNQFTHTLFTESMQTVITLLLTSTKPSLISKSLTCPSVESII